MCAEVLGELNGTGERGFSNFCISRSYWKDYWNCTLLAWSSSLLLPPLPPAVEKNNSLCQEKHIFWCALKQTSSFIMFLFLYCGPQAMVGPWR